MELTLFFVFLVAIGWVAIKTAPKSIGTEENLIRQADAGLRWELMGNSAYGFADGEFQVMHRKDEFYRQDEVTISGYNCHFLLRNSKGQYLFFLFRYDEPPYIKSTSQEVAKALLGDRYLAPPEGP